MNRSSNNPMSRGYLGWLSRALVVSASAMPSLVYADTATSTATKAAEVPKPAAAPYTLPFELRGIAPAKVFRIDSSVATFHSTKGAEPSLVSIFNLGYAFTPELGLLARVGYINGGTPTDARRGSIFSNPALVAIYAPKIAQDFRVSGVLGVVAPLGGGGGDTPDPKSKLARTGAVLARSAMQNALFSANDLSFVPGIDVAYVKSGVTLQAEASVIVALRMRGEKDQPDESKINFTGGLHFGYFLAPWISVGTELRYQRWIAPPKAVDNAANRDQLMDTMSLAVGPRFHIKLSDKSWFRPAITYTRGLDDPMAASNYQLVQLDLPFSY